MKSFGKIDNDIGGGAGALFPSVFGGMSCIQLARATGYLCRDGAHPLDGSQVVSERQARRLNALMLTCGTRRRRRVRVSHRIAVQERRGRQHRRRGTRHPEPVRVVAGAGRDRQFAAGHEGLELFVAQTRLSVF